MFLIKKMLHLNPRKRITAAQALKHPYFNDLPSEVLNLYNPEGRVSKVKEALKMKPISEQMEEENLEEK